MSSNVNVIFRAAENLQIRFSLNSFNACSPPIHVRLSLYLCLLFGGGDLECLGLGIWRGGEYGLLLRGDLER